MAELRTYEAVVNGFKTRLKLTEEEQQRLYPDATPVEEAGAEESGTKSRTTANKSRTAENK